MHAQRSYGTVVDCLGSDGLRCTDCEWLLYSQDLPFASSSDLIESCAPHRQGRISNLPRAMGEQASGLFRGFKEE